MPEIEEYLNRRIIRNLRPTIEQAPQSTFVDMPILPPELSQATTGPRRPTVEEYVQNRSGKFTLGLPPGSSPEIPQFPNALTLFHNLPYCIVIKNIYSIYNCIVPVVGRIIIRNRILPKQSIFGKFHSLEGISF